VWTCLNPSKYYNQSYGKEGHHTGEFKELYFMRGSKTIYLYKKTFTTRILQWVNRTCRLQDFMLQL